jgi:IS1 family transposase
LGNFFSRQIGCSGIHTDIAELDELYHFLGFRAKSETKENIYILVNAGRFPRQLLGIVASKDKSPETIERLVQNSPHAKQYFSDGYQGYKYVDYPGKFKQNFSSKNDTFTVESCNSDLRHFIPTLRRRSKCFPRKIENLNAVLKLFAYAYNLFGIWKSKYCQAPVNHKSANPNKKLRKSRYPNRSHLDFLFGH